MKKRKKNVYIIIWKNDSRKFKYIFFEEMKKISREFKKIN